MTESLIARKSILARVIEQRTGLGYNRVRTALNLRSEHVCLPLFSFRSEILSGTGQQNMGLLRFTVSSDDLIRPEDAEVADFVTFDGRVIGATSSLDDGLLFCNRVQAQSSKLRIPCHFSGRSVVLQTTALPESNSEYNLEKELARGELSRLRNFFHLWTGAGLKSCDKLDAKISEAHACFRSAVFSEDPATSVECIRLTHEAIELLTEVYTRQRITFRRQRNQRFPLMVGCVLNARPENEQAFLTTFNAAMVSTRWSTLEPVDGDYQWEELDELIDWVVSNRLAAVGGPLLDLSEDHFPKWITPWKNDLVNMESFTADFVETVVSRYVGRIRHWEVVCGANRGILGGMSEEQRLHLVVRTIEAAQQVDEQIQISLRVVQPWGEYLNATANRLPAIQFIDTIRRSGAQVGEISLDFRFGPFSDNDLHSLPRDLLSVSQLLDHWSLLQIPINVIASLPHTDHTDDFAELQTWQTDFLEQLIMMSLSKERVNGFYCQNWADEHADSMALVDPDGNMHNALAMIGAFESTHWIG